MSEWSFAVQPDIAVTVRERRKPALLARCLGDEVAHVPDPTLLLDLTSLGDSGSGALRSDYYKGIRWTCRVNVSPDGRHTIAWRSPLLREYLALHVALLPALRRLLLERDIALVAGSAFDIDGRATVLAGDTGSGKTSALLAALGAGARLIGDEYLGITGTGEVTAVLRVLALRRAALAAAPQLRPHATRRLMLRAAELAASLSGLRLDPLVHVSPGELGISVADRAAHISKLIFLERTKDSQASRQQMDAAQAIDALARAQEVHDRVYAVPASLAMSEKDIARCRDVLARGLREVECLRLSLPHGTLPADVLRELIGTGQPGPLARTSA